MKIRILGTGAMACWLGALVARTGASVTLVGSWPAALARLRSRGIAFESPGLRFEASVLAQAVGETPAPADVCVLLAKATQTAHLAGLAWQGLSAPPLVLCLQNGLGAGPVLDAAGGARSATGVTTVGALLLGPGHVQASGLGQVALGWSGPDAPAQASNTRLVAFAELLNRARIDARLVADIDVHVWRKLVANCAINAPAALHGVPNGALLERAELRALLVAAAREAAQVALACGVDLAHDPVELATSVVQETAGNRCSMLQDLERGVPTEVEAIYGRAIDLARAQGVATPTLVALHDAVRGIEQRRQSAQATEVSA